MLFKWILYSVGCIVVFDKIIKRNQEVVPFEREKIQAAVFKALVVTDEGRSRDVLKHLAVAITDKVIYDLILNNNDMPSVEEIQDTVEMALMSMGEHHTAKVYIKYRYKHLEQRTTKRSAMDILSLFDDFLEETPDRIGQMAYSIQGLNQHIVGKATKHFWLNQIYSDSVRTAHETCDIHIHDLEILSSSCTGWDFEELLKKGFGLSGMIESDIPKHFKDVLSQMVHFVYTLQHEAAGVQTISNFDTLLAPFVRQDNLTYKEVKDYMLRFIYDLNLPTITSTSLNVTLDKVVPLIYAEKPVLLGGVYHYDLKYKNFQKEVDMINQVILEIMTVGDVKGRPFSHPMLTYNITDEWSFNDEIMDRLLDLTIKFGIPYYNNYRTSDLKYDDLKLTNHYLRIEKNKLFKRGGGLYGSNPKSGSIGLVTINLSRLGHASNTMENLFERLERMMEIAKDALETKRRVLEDNIIKGLYPYSKKCLQEVYSVYSGYWNNHFSTIGINGMNECIRNMTDHRESILTSTGKTIAEEILDFMNEVLLRFQNETGYLYNLEATPHEHIGKRFALSDIEYYPDIYTSNENYTPATLLPYDHQEDIFDYLDHQESLLGKYSGGSIFTMNIPLHYERNHLRDVLIRVTHDYKVPYFTIEPNFRICPTHDYIQGRENYCPICSTELIEWKKD
jgi:ribonucleoside-triphosphate reductase